MYLFQNTYVRTSSSLCSGFDVPLIKSIENTDLDIPSALLGYSHNG